jgi:predicted ATPase
VFRDIRMLQQSADEMLSIAGEHNMVLLSFLTAFIRGWSKAAGGRSEAGIVEMRRILEDPMFADALVAHLMLVTLAETCGKNGRADDGLDLVAQGLSTAEHTGQKMAEAELYRLKGEMMMIKNRGNVAEAERHLRIAIEVARRQGARLFELRATVSLARVLRDTNRRDEARAMLAEIYNWFTEGFDTPDLKDAKSLLEELAA